MVRMLAAACLMLLAGIAAAQEAPVPTNMAQPGIAGDAPAGPGATGAAAGGAAGEAGAFAETDLAGLVLKAHWVVQGVMATLALSVAVVLTVFLFKAVEFALAFARLRRAQALLAAGTGLAALPGDCPLARAARAAADEVAGLPPVLTADLRAAARERLEMRLDRIEAGAVMRLRSGGGLLASIGAVGPFVGLFGTVFGIMNSFLAIAATKTTNLSVVAPGIAEALLATGIGLVAAIPAVLLYNAMMRRIAAFRHGLADGRAEVLARFSRTLDARMAAGG